MKKKPCWYHVTVAACPVCGRGTTTRERRYDEKPANHEDRYHYADRYDWCEG